uniref:AlNc14C248G9589 protein n=1 Tax=Albugo laibachii Nc14 TaxID=890382 RepID=F0WTA4_9STRA|nr:AlNc14C248G9589 [Albugo laibachii Nc14]|eukprot:CCA24593.1 AlNc14C248G9589 [Albugo laibachii Nc14]
MVNEEDDSLALLMDRNLMEIMGYSVEAILQGKREKQAIWDASVDGATAVQTPDKRCLFTPEVKHIEAQQDTINNILKEKVHEVQEVGVAMELVDRLKDMFIKYGDIFRVEFALEPPVKVAPLQDLLEEGSTPFMTNSRRQPPLHRNYMDKHLADLMEHDLIYRNLDSRWGIAPRIVAKKEVGSYRMTVDLRAINAVLVPMAWPMPHLEVVLVNLEG